MIKFAIEIEFRVLTYSENSFHSLLPSYLNPRDGNRKYGNGNGNIEIGNRKYST